MSQPDRNAPGLGGTRREARERAIELLYEAETKSTDAGDVVAALPIPPDPYAVELAVGVGDHQIEIDRILDRYARSWPVKRMAAMDRAVLRMGVFELATQHEVPTGACLSEAVDLGGEYGSTDDTSKFVNGILSNVADEVRGDPGANRSRTWTPIEIVVFDMDGVIRHWEGQRSKEFEAVHGLPSGSVGEAAFALPRFRDAMTGRHSAQEWAALIGEELSERFGVPADDAATMWLTTDWRLDDDVVALIGSLRTAGTRIAVFSNASTRLEADMDTMGITDLFDVIANSSLIGEIKPDVAAFDAVVDLLDTDPARLLFIDDRPENVGGAVDAGWHAVEMRGAARLRRVLARLGVAGSDR